MGFREAWKSLFSSKQYSGYGQPVVSYHQTGYNNRTKKDSYADLAKEGYVENAVAFRCVN